MLPSGVVLTLRRRFPRTTESISARLCRTSETMPVPTKPPSTSTQGESSGLQPPKPSQKTTKAERRELQERQRAAKTAKQAVASGSGTQKTPATPSPITQKKPPPRLSDAGVKSPAVKPPKETRDVVSNPPDDREEKSRGLRIFSHFGLTKQLSNVVKGNVHPSVIRLGLQFSEFKISGANARCIATLTAFKTVRLTFTSV